MEVPQLFGYYFSWCSSAYFLPFRLFGCSVSHSTVDVPELFCLLTELFESQSYSVPAPKTDESVETIVTYTIPKNLELTVTGLFLKE
jgi:hypothetical protein